jgi:alginate O-acetyltransferase complex protein AlgI
VLFCTPLPAKLWEKIEKTPLGPVILLAIFWGAVYCLYRGLNDPFLYFRF